MVNQSYLFKSERLGFREWSDNDSAILHQINTSPKAMMYFPKISTKEETSQMHQRIKSHFVEHGFGLYAVDNLNDHHTIGFIGFAIPGFNASFTPCIEIGWRLLPDYWNQGLATEGAKRCLDFGFQTLNFSEVHSFTSILNLPSERVMQKIGMKKIDEFDHPKVEKGHRLERHVLYYIQYHA